jgi:hypothetical protein
VRSLKIIILILFSLACLKTMLPASAAQKSAAPNLFAKSVQPFLAEHCYACHNSKQQSGGLNLQAYQTAASITENRQVWERVVRKLQTGQMPPKGLPRPDRAALETVTRWLEQQFERADQLAKPDPGRVTARRLNRAEYNNTVRDLLGVDIEPASDFPQDDSAHGFDNMADALSLSPTLMEKYMAAAEKISRLAVFGPDLKPLTFRVEPTRPRRMEINPVRIEQPPFYTMFDYDVTGISHPGSYHLRHRFPASGEYLLRVRADGARPQGSEPQRLNLYIDGKIAETFEVPDKVTETNERLPVFMEARLKVTAGEHQLIAAFPNLFDGLSPAIGGPNPSKRPQPPPPDPEKVLPPLPANATAAQIEGRKAAIERFRSRKPQFGGFAIAEFEIVGPYEYVKGLAPESARKLYSCGHMDGSHQADCQGKIIKDLAHRAFRRPLEAGEAEALVALASGARQRGRSFEQALALAVQAILVSPDFLFRIEKDRSPQGASASAAAYPLSQHELASRLSYFLWSSMPDDELLGCADKGALRRPAVLTAQVRRMLKSEKVSALVENFAGQWLEIRRLESVQPDRDRFPDFDDYLRHSMLKETELFFQNIIDEDRSIVDFVVSKQSFLNERLARHYGIKGVSGAEFRKVDLSGSGRAGILTQASVLTVSSYGNRTSPVLRGKWILENLLNAPPPPAPANVPALDEAAIGNTGTLRQQMEQHRENPVCASCHAQMDPLGFSLENYDAVGAWRTMDGKFSIDTTGALPDGRRLKGAEDLINILKSERRSFAEGLTEKLLTYGLGRGLGQGDRATVRKIAAKVAASEYRFSSLVLEIVRSLPFQMRIGEQSQ